VHAPFSWLVHAESDDWYPIAHLTVARFAIRLGSARAVPGARMSRTLLATMSVPISFPDPARGDEAVRDWRWRDALPAVVTALAVAAGTAALGVLAGLAWAAVAPRPLLVMTAPGAAALVNTETTAFIAADAAFFVARWVGEHSGLATFQHQLATLPVGARLRDSLTLGATSALGFWALGAGVVAGGLELLTSPGRHRARKTAPVVRHVDGPAGEGAGSID